MPRLHQVERQLMDAIALACPSVYRRWFQGWTECDRQRRENPGGKNCAPCYRDRCHAWHIMSDAVDEAGCLQLAALMRTMPAVMPMLMRWTMHERAITLQRRALPRTSRGRSIANTGTYSYDQTAATQAFTNHDRACLEMFDVLLTRPRHLMAYARIPGESESGNRARLAGRVSYKNGTIGTWNAMPLGTLSSGLAYQNNMRDGRVPITVQCINGCEYSGTYFFTAGDYCRLRMVQRDKTRVEQGRWDFDCPMLKDGNPVQFPTEVTAAPPPPIAMLQ